jgi:hypothetical protein
MCKLLMEQFNVNNVGERILCRVYNVCSAEQQAGGSAQYTLFPGDLYRSYSYNEAGGPTCTSNPTASMRRPAVAVRSARQCEHPHTCQANTDNFTSSDTSHETLGDISFYGLYQQRRTTAHMICAQCGHIGTSVG